MLLFTSAYYCSTVSYLPHTCTHCTRCNPTVHTTVNFCILVYPADHTLALNQPLHKMLMLWYATSTCCCCLYLLEPTLFFLVCNALNCIVLRRKSLAFVALGCSVLHGSALVLHLCGITLYAHCICGVLHWCSIMLHYFILEVQGTSRPLLLAGDPLGFLTF